MAPSFSHTYPLPSPRMGSQILPKAYEKSERLVLELWDPRRLASHVLATLSPIEQRAAAVDLILELKITGSFLSHYTYQIEELLPNARDCCELIRAIAGTVPKTFWIPLSEPPAHDKYSVQDIANELGRGVSRSVEEEHVVPAAAEHASTYWIFEEDEEAVAEVREIEEDKPLPEPPAEEGDPALEHDDHKVPGRYTNNDEAGREDCRVLEGERHHGVASGAGDGDDDGDKRYKTNTNVWRSLWGQVSESFSVNVGLWETHSQR